MLTITVTAIIPNYNGTNYLENLIKSLKMQTRPFDEIIFIDDASTDESVSFLETQAPDIIVISNNRNEGFAKSVNIGIKRATSNYVALINNDILLKEDWLENALKVINSREISGVATNILIANTMDRIDSQGDNYFINGIALKRNNLQTNDETNLYIDRVFSACAAAAIFNKEIIEKAGLFDEFFESYYEDVDLAFRLNLMGYKIIYTPYAICYHYLNSSYKKQYDKMLFNIFRNEEIVFWTNMPRNLLLKYCLSRVVFILLQIIVKLFKFQLIIYIKAKCSLMSNIKYLVAKRRLNMQLMKISNSDLYQLLSKDWINQFITKFIKI